MLEANQIRERLQASRRELLDLTYRNRLLNFTESVSKGIRVIDENPLEILRILYDEQQRMSFAPVSGQAGGPGEPIDPENALEQYVARKSSASVDDLLGRHQDKYLQTPFVRAVLESRLLNTFYDARTTIEEHGVNTLFLALGMLTYADPMEKDRLFKAPILLLPAALERQNARSDFWVSYNGDEIGHNVSLQAKLKDFGVDWPELPPEDEEHSLDLNAYFDRIDAAIRDKPGWKLDRQDIQLAFFSFHKYVMHQDLDDRKWPEETPLVGQPILRWLLGDDNLPVEGPVVPADQPLDDLLAPDTLFHVVEADSSQAEALAEIGSGKSMIIQGPPGTGKSQTITNLIAQAVAKGKTVLFVAEKMAALEVVKRRLANIGLDDIVIELHSNKTNKRDFLNRLKAVWDKGEPVVKGVEEAFAGLTSYIHELNTHGRLVNHPVGPSGRSAYFLFGRLLQLNRELADQNPPAFTLENWTQWTASKFNASLETAKRLEIVMGELGRLADHPFRDSQVTTVLPMDLPAVEAAAREAGGSLRALQEGLGPLAGQLGLGRALAPREIRALLMLVRQAGEWPDLAGLPLENRAWATQQDGLATLIGQVRKIQEAKAPLLNTLTEKAWADPDAAAVHEMLSGYRTIWYRWFCPAYRAASAKAAALWRIRPPFRLSRRLETLQAVLDVQNTEKALAGNQEAAASLFGPYWAGERSDCVRLTAISGFLRAFHSAGLAPDLFGALARELGPAGRRARATAEAARIEPLFTACTAVLGGLLTRLQVERQALAPDRGFDDYRLDEQAALLKAWAENSRSLMAMARYNALRKEAVASGLAPLQDACSSWGPAPAHLVRLLELRWSEALLKAHLEGHPSLGQFSRGLADRLVQSFRESDVFCLKLNRGRILLRHHRQLPNLGSPGEMAVLSREFSKRARHLPIRTLLDKCGLAVQKAKPVFMMSPYSVASYLPKGPMTFDLVIFDEASQVRPVEAFGAIARGRQVIVVGDSRQLPPTAFFEQIQGDDDEESGTASQTRDIESILKQFESKGAFSAMLRWHYRSRHHTLIGYSNKAFYEDRLVVFPSPSEESQWQGLQFVHVPEGVYHRGDKKAKNPIEAERIVRDVQAHIHRHADKSLGVVAFSMSQMREVQDRMEVLRREDPEVDAFFACHLDEPFFVKNLENVQGDERDVIFISVGYGRDESGGLSMNFGPLNKDGGERRLNVLISRAKERCVVYSNIRGKDLDMTRTSAKGVLHLQGILQYAEGLSGAAPALASGGEAGHPFDEEVAAAIGAAGYPVRRNVGASGCRLDLVVQDPGTPGRSILGIECDGESYQAAKWARDRDRLRQQVLQGLGWRLHRVWSRAWFDDPRAELDKILAAIKASQEAPAPIVPPDSGVFQFERREVPPVEADQAAAAYDTARLGRICVNEELAAVAEARLADWLQKVVQAEAPVHADVAVRRIVEAAGLTRIGVRARQRLEGALAALVQRGKVVRKGDFLWTADRLEPAVRDRAQADALVKNIDHVAPEELETAFRDVVTKALSIGREECCREVLGLLGLDMLSQQRRAVLERVYGKMLAEGTLAERNGALVIGSRT